MFFFTKKSCLYPCSFTLRSTSIFLKVYLIVLQALQNGICVLYLYFAFVFLAAVYFYFSKSA